MYEYQILTIGHLPPEGFFEETENQPFPGAGCTSTLLRGYLNILVDPSLPPDEMEKLLFNCSALGQKDIDVVFVTHGHEDHIAGIEHFQRARWFIDRAELEVMKQSADERLLALAKKFEPCGPNTSTELIAGLKFIPFPGHTPGSTGIVFNSPGGQNGSLRVCIAGDAVMTRDRFDQASPANQKIAGLADIVVPGHDNYFFTKPHS